MTTAASTVPIGDHALLADLRTGPLVSREGSIDWLCLPRFDSAPVFSHLLGDPDGSRWSLCARGGEVVTRSYEDQSFVLRTEWLTPTGRMRVTDFMPIAGARTDLVRMVECLTGEVVVEQEFVARFDYGTTTPWVRRVTTGGGASVLSLIGGPDALALSGPPLVGADQRHVGAHRLTAGQTAAWTLTWHPSYRPIPEPPDVGRMLAETRSNWQDWCHRIHPSPSVDGTGRYASLVERSLLVLRALTNRETGGIVAAPTTSLPEDLGGVRNWDYRYCWLRDSALTLQAMLRHGLTSGAAHWRDWLLRAVAGDPDDLQIMYGIAGERHLAERELPQYSGYAQSRPVRVGNGAVHQFQADVVGEVMIALAELRGLGVADDAFSWPLQVQLLGYAEKRLELKDQGLWEMRGHPRWFTHSRVMTWAGFDRGIEAVERFGLPGPVDRWRTIRDRLGNEIEEQGFNRDTGSFRQSYDDEEVDASLLQLPHTGFVDFDDPRMLGTVARIESDLVGRSGLPVRYRTQAGKDGLVGDEHPFLACAFWLVEQYARSGRGDDAVRLMDRIVDHAGELGLFAEELDAEHRRHIGNFPQAFSHLALIRAADAIEDGSPSRPR